MAFEDVSCGGEIKSLCENGCRFILVVCRGWLGPGICCYKYMKVVLTYVCDPMYHCVGLFVFRAFLEVCIAVSLCMRGISAVILYGR